MGVVVGEDGGSGWKRSEQVKGRNGEGTRYGPYGK